MEIVFSEFFWIEVVRVSRRNQETFLSIYATFHWDQNTNQHWPKVVDCGHLKIFLC